MPELSDKKPTSGKGNRTAQRERRKARELAKKVAEEDDEVDSLSQIDAVITAQLLLLEKRTKGRPTDADADLDFAYRNMALANVMPIEAPSTAAWSWYVFARSEPNEFLKITQKREDAKAKLAGTITSQRMEDDKRQQFAILDRIEKQLTIDVKAIVKDLMEKFPQDVLTECRKFDAAWKEFIAREPT
jgi:hypothetical protein